MPRIRVVLYRDDEGSVPLLDWLDGMPSKAVDKCRVRIERLRDLGHELRRPEADLLREGVYELRVGLQGVNYRMLYFFYGRSVAVLSHGVIKKRIVPSKEIDKVIQHRTRFEADPGRYTYMEP